MTTSWCRGAALSVALVASACGAGSGDVPLAPDATPPASDAALIDPTDGASFDVAPNDASPDCRVAQDDGTICTCVELGAKPSTLYLVLDRSSSMGATVPGSTRTRWNVVRSALLDPDRGVLRRLGGRVAVGATVFPKGGDDETGCAPGYEAFPTTRGAPAVYDELQEKLATYGTKGATPIAATIRALAPALHALPKPVSVLLATDGAPNCGTRTCTTARCGYNVERATVGTAICDESTNCCDPSQVAQGLGWGACVDTDDASDAIAELAADGIRVFVLGLDTDKYAADLDALAVAGGTAREGASPRYYAPASVALDALGDALSAIAGAAFDSCEIRLEAPVDAARTNVLLDGVAVPREVGWTLAAPDRIALVGDACARAKAGEIGQVQVVSGCRTVTR